MGRIRRTGVVALVLVSAHAVAACRDGSDDGSGAARSARSSPPAAPTTTVPGETTTPSENPACALVTQADAEAVFGAPARRGEPLGVEGESVCAWHSDGDGTDQALSFRLHDGSDSSTVVASPSPVNITVQRTVDGRTFAFVYLAERGDADAKQAAVNDLADSVVARGE